MDRREIDASRKKGEKVGCQSAGRLAIDEYAMRVRNRVRRAGEVTEEGGEGRVGPSDGSIFDVLATCLALRINAEGQRQYPLQSAPMHSQGA